MLKAVCRADGLALKFVSPNLNGVPDRLLLFHGGRIAFAEVKAPGKRPRPLQEHRIEQLRLMGFKVYVVDDEEQIDQLIEDMKKDTSLTGSQIGGPTA